MSDDNPTIDHATAEGEGGSPKLEDHIKSRRTWLRFLFMLAYGLLLSVAGMLGGVIVLLGFLWLLFTGDVNRQLRETGQVIAGWFYEVVRYLTFNTDDKPFPFGGDLPPASAEPTD